MQTPESSTKGISDMTTTDLIKCAERELALRHRVYPKRVTLNMMTQSKAEHEITCMAEILVLLRQREESERLL